MNLITKEGYIIEKPEEYRRNKQLLKAHYRSSSPNRDAAKTKKGGKKQKEEQVNPELYVDKENHGQFMDDVKNAYQLEN